MDAGFAGGKCVLVAGGVARPAGRRRHRRRRADEVEEDEGLQRVSSCSNFVQRPSYKECKDNVAEIALGARHCEG
jgi:hypothetical protein